MDIREELEKKIFEGEELREFSSINKTVITARNEAFKEVLGLLKDKHLLILEPEDVWYENHLGVERYCIHTDRDSVQSQLKQLEEK